MLKIKLSVEDLANTRFAISPLTETVFSLPAITDPSRHALHLPWLRAIRGRLGPDDEPLLHALVGPVRIPHEYAGNASRPVPDFLTPRPARFAPRFEDELARARETEPAIVRRDLAATYAPDPVPGVLRTRDRRGAGRLLHAVCDALERHWRRSIEPSWEQMQLVLEADTTYRARRLATGGAQLLFADIHPNVRWHDGALSITEMVSEGTIDAAGRGLLLIPSIFAYKPVPPLGPDQPPSLGYPSRGIGTLWSPPPEPDSAALVELLGRPRTVLLEMLAEPLPTVELARRLRVTPSAVSQHLRVLRRTGLVTGARDRRQVLYRRTPLAERLTGSADIGSGS
jgi:DNA-binding transcriptional ArsR family regulator